MAKRNWDKPVKFDLEKRERKEKAEKVSEFVEDKTGRQGKAATARGAIDLAFEHIKQLEEEEESRKEDLAKYYRKVDQVAEEMKK